MAQLWHQAIVLDLDWITLRGDLWHDPGGRRLLLDLNPGTGVVTLSHDVHIADVEVEQIPCCSVLVSRVGPYSALPEQLEELGLAVIERKRSVGRQRDLLVQVRLLTQHQHS